MAVDQLGMDVRVKYDDSMLNSGRIIRLRPLGPILRTIVQNLIAFSSRPEAASDVISGTVVGPIVPDEPVKFGDTSLNHSLKIPPEAIGGGIFDSFCSSMKR